MKELLRPAEAHPSQRGWFARALHEAMETNPNVVVVTGDLGYKMLDKIRDDYPDQFINVGAAEQTMIGVAVGLALKGKIPVVYSISTFLLYRPFEAIRNYIDHEAIPVKLVGGGRDRDYSHDGFSHWAEDDRKVMELFTNIEAQWPETKEEIPDLVERMLADNKPWYLNLRR